MWISKPDGYEADTKKELKNKLLNLHCAVGSDTTKLRAGCYKLELETCDGVEKIYTLERK